jgi:hypothetical protein
VGVRLTQLPVACGLALILAKATTVKEHKRDISKRTKRGTIRKGQSERIVTVSAHSRKAWKGYGKVYGLTREERSALKNAADKIIDELFNA